MGQPVGWDLRRGEVARIDIPVPIVGYCAVAIVGWLGRFGYRGWLGGRG
jgi:hypothetical protein